MTICDGEELSHCVVGVSRAVFFGRYFAEVVFGRELDHMTMSSVTGHRDERGVRTGGVRVK